MGTSALSRGLGVLMAASLAASVATADAQNVIGLHTVQAPAGPNSDAVLKIVDETGADSVTTFMFKVYYNANQAALVNAFDINPTADSFVSPANPEADNVAKPAESEYVALGFTHYKEILGETGDDPWLSVGDLAGLNFRTTENFSGKLNVLLTPMVDFDSWYYDADFTQIEIEVSSDPTVVYSSPVIEELNREGIHEGAGDHEIVISGHGFFGNEPGEPVTEFRLNGEVLEVVSLSETAATVKIPATAVDAISGPGLFEDLPLVASNGTGYVDSSDIYTLVSRDQVHVDRAFAVVDNYKRVGNGQITGANAFAAITGGVSAVNETGSVLVAAGTYAETTDADGAIHITKALSLVGPNAGLDGTDEDRGPEAVIVPGTSLNGTNASSLVPVILVTADNVSIDGFTISGDNETIDGYEYANMNTEAGTGVKVEASDVTFQNNIVNKFTMVGFFSWTNNQPAHLARHNIFVLNNKFEDITDMNALGYGMAIYVQNSTGRVNDNTILNSRHGMQIQPYQAAADVDAGHVVEVLNNHIEAWRAGIYYNYTEKGASAWLIANNTVQACLAPAGFTQKVIWEGIMSETQRDTGNGGVIQNNTIDGSVAQADPAHDNVGDFAEAVWGLRYKGHNSTSSDLVFTQNDVSNVTIGFIHDAPSDIVFTGNTFANITNEAIRLQQYYSSTGELALRSGAPYGGTGNVDARGGNTIDGVNTADAGITLNELFAVEDRITHKVDNGDLGLVRVIDERIYVTQDSGSVQRGVNAADAGDTVHVDSGTYAEFLPSRNFGLLVNKELTLLGPNAGNPGSSTLRNPEALIIPGERLNATSRLSSGYTRLMDWKPVVYLASDKIVFDGFAVSGVNDDIVDAEGPVAITDYLNLSAATGIYIVADEVVVQNNALTGFSYIGLYAEGRRKNARQNHDLHIADNLVTEVHSPNGYGYGYYIGGSSGIIENNHARNVRTGMNIQPYDHEGPETTVRGNHLAAWMRGLWFNYTENDAASWTFSDNHITASPVPSGLTLPVIPENSLWTGIATQTQYASGNGGLFVGNTVDGSGATIADTVGIFVNSSIRTPTDDLVFENNTIENVDIGVRLGISGTATYAGRATFRNNNTIRDTQVALDIDAVNTSPHIFTDNTIEGNEVGIRVRNSGVVNLSGNTLTNNAIQFAFETTADDSAKVNTFDLAGLAATDLEAIVNLNIVSGKTYLSSGMADVQGALVPETFGTEPFVLVRNTIQGSVDAPGGVATGNTVLVMTDVYAERVHLNKTARLQAAPGATIHPNAVDSSSTHPGAVYVQAANAHIDGFIITRDQVTGADWRGESPEWGAPALHSGIHLRPTPAVNGTKITNNEISQYFNGVYVNNTPNTEVRGNRVFNNRFAIQIANNVTGSEITNNWLNDNVFAGIGFTEPGSTVNETTALTIRDNHIAGNLAYEVLVDWVAAKTSVLDLSGNWFGTVAPVIDDTASDHLAIVTTHPSAIDHIATIGGVAANRLIDYNAWLASGAEHADASVTDRAFEGDFSTLYIAGSSPLAGTEDSHIADALALLEDGVLSGGERQILATPGVYEDGIAVVNKPVTIAGIGADRTDATFNPIASGQTGIEISASNVTVENLSLAGLAGRPYGAAIYRGTTALHNDTHLLNLVVENAGITDSVAAVELGQPVNSPVNSTGNRVENCLISNSTYTSLALLGGVTNVSGNNFAGGSYQGLYVGPDGRTLGSPATVVVSDNDFSGLLWGVRVVNATDDTVVGGATEDDGNRFALGSGLAPSVGVSVEYSGNIDVANNTFTYTNSATLLGTGSVGVYVWHTGTPVPVSNNTFTAPAGNPGVGVAAIGRRTFPLGSGEANDTWVQVSGNSFTGLYAGVMAANSDSAATALKVDVTNNSTFVDCENGVLLNGSHALASITGNDFGNQSTNGINIVDASDASTIKNNQFGSIDTANQKYIVNTSSKDFAIDENEFNGVSPVLTDIFNPTQAQAIYIIQAGLVDGLDETGYGLLRFDTEIVPVPVSKIGVDSSDNGLVHRAALAAQARNVLLLSAGVFNDKSALIEKGVMVVASGFEPDLDEQVYTTEIQHGLTFELNDNNFTGVTGIRFTSNGSVTMRDLVAPAGNATGIAYLVSDCEFDGLPQASTAVTVDQANGVIVVRNRIQDSGAGVLVRNSANVSILDNNILDNYDTGIAINKTDDDLTPDGIIISGNFITGSGRVMAEAADVEAQNYNAYGIFAGAFGPNASSVIPFNRNLLIQDNTITENAATGISLWHANSDGAGESTIYRNTVENNGIWRKGEAYNVYKQNTDGLKLKHSQNVKVEHNKIRYNERNNVLVEGNAPFSGAGVELAYNHLDGNSLIVNNVGQDPSLGGALMLQITSPQAAATDVIANNNWWGHVYGPKTPDNPTGRGDRIVYNGGNAVVTSWYGQRSSSQRFYALNDRDGDGIIDAHEDLDLSGGRNTELWGVETLIADHGTVSAKDSDGDGYEDGVEIACGSDPLDPNSTPMDINGDGLVITSNPYAWDGTTDFAKSLIDTDGDGYADFYEVAQGTDPKDPDDSPRLGRIRTDEGPANIAQATWLRQLMVGARAFDDPTLNPADPSGYLTNQDNGDLNRDGVVNNADLVFIRRFINNVSVHCLPVIPGATTNP